MNINGRELSLAHIIIGAGVVLLFAQIFGFSIGAVSWPFFVIAPGAVFLYLAYTGDEDKAGFIFPGAIVTGTGLILLYQSMTGHWSSWAYAWTLYPLFVGLAVQFHGRRTHNQHEVEKGYELAKGAGMAFIGFFLFFEVLIFGGIQNLAMILIGGGILMLVLRNKGVEFELPKSKRVYSNGTAEKVKNDEYDQYDPII